MIAERISAQVFNQQTRSKVPQMARRKLCIKMVHTTGRVAWLEEVPAGKEGAREQASTLFLLSLYLPQKKLQNNPKKSSKVFFI